MNIIKKIHHSYSLFPSLSPSTKPNPKSKSFHNPQSPFTLHTLPHNPKFPKLKSIPFTPYLENGQLDFIIRIIK